MKRTLYILLMCSALFTACNSNISIDRQLDAEADIFPDYKEVTIPCNIAPMCFQLNDAKDIDTHLIIEGGNGKIQVKGEDGDFDIPIDKWHKLLAANRDTDLHFTVCRLEDGKWAAYRPFTMHVASDSIDAYLAYRLIPPGYGLWNAMGIYQRCLESFEETPIMENRQTEYNCMNCHTFQSQNPKKMCFHLRGNHGGSVLVRSGQVEKLNPEFPDTIKGIAYPAWHPYADYIAFSSNRVAQSFFVHHRQRIEVFDTRSDAVVLDIARNRVITAPELSSTRDWETWPAFSADGKTLYYCTAPIVEPMPQEYKKVHFSVCTIGFDPETGTFGQQVDTLFNAGDSLSFNYPRESPDGRWLVYNRQECGYFPINHKESDLWLRDQKTGETRPLEAANSNDCESYHTWSHNSHWLGFSSRRIDGLYVCAYFTYIDNNGQATKAFIMPQRHPRTFYDNQLNSYNIPEFITDAVEVSQHTIAETVW